MTPIRFASLGMPAAIALAAIGVLTAHSAAAPSVSQTDTNVYRLWHRVTPHRVDMSRAMAMRCAQLYVANPHENADYHVYVNPIGEDALLREIHPTFPPGSVLVKEKFKHDARDPEVLTVMRKREAGFDLKNGDWEYFVQVPPRGKLIVPADVEKCRSCHREAWRSDYVYRYYTPIYSQQVAEMLRKWSASHPAPLRTAQ